jgi:hypothetical protein
MPDCWAQVQGLRARLGPRIHFLPIFLVNESDRDMLGLGEQFRAVVLDDLVVCHSECEAVKMSMHFVFPAMAGFECLRPRMHCKKEGPNQH